ncbi:MAG: hypothetical protein IPP77_15700 [Bacteroidetes bacterium]|nr:hypothetical protein [Bacteroidota bacterium]
MIYFKKVNLNGADRQRIETAIRQFAVKRNTSLDFQSSATCIRQEKYFLGLESESNLTLTRIRTPFERLLPKLILQFSKEDFNKYKVRFSFVSIFVAFLLSVGVLLQLIYSIKNSQLSSNLWQILFFALIFIALTWFEIKLTTDKINKAIEKAAQN